MDWKGTAIFFVMLLGLIASVAMSYNHFVIEKNYVLEYEASCDPASEACFVYSCNADDADCEPYDYKVLIKNASDVYASCGDNLVDCEAAQMCQPADTLCEVVYCDESEGETCSETLQVEIDGPLES